MDPAWIALGLTGLLVALLLFGSAPAEAVALLMLVATVVLGLLPPRDALAGFANPSVVALIFIFLVAQGIEASGLARRIATWLRRHAGGSERRLLAVVMATTAFLSLFMNTVAAAAVLLSPTLDLARRQRISPARLLLPMGYGALLGGMATLLTTANLVVSAALEAHGYEPFGVFDFLPVGLPATLVGIAFMVLVGRRLLPNTSPMDESGPRRALADALRQYGLARGVHAYRLRPDSRLIGRPARRPHTARELGLTPVGLIQGDRFAPVHALAADVRLQAGDIILLAGQPSPSVLRDYGLEPWDRVAVEALLRRGGTFAEVILNPRGQAAGQTPQSLRLRERYGALVVALWRHGRAHYHDLHRQVLHEGDALLLLIPPENVALLAQDPDFLLLARSEPRPVRPWAPWVAGGLLALMLALTAFRVLPLALAAILSASGVVALGLVRPQEAYRAIPWRAIFLIAGVFPLSTALVRTGAARMVMDVLLRPLGHAPAWVLAWGMLWLSAALAQVMSGQVAALVLAPLALTVAESHGVSAHAMAMAVALGASMAFLLPTGHPVNLLVMGPGGYRPRDYVRVGLPLALVVTPVVVALLPYGTP